MGSLEGRNFHVEKENDEGTDGCFSLIHAVGLRLGKQNGDGIRLMIRLRQTTVLRAVYIMTAATMSMPMKYRKKTARPRRKP